MPEMAAHGLDPAEEPIQEISEALGRHQYIVNRPLATVLYLVQQLETPLLLEGEPGVGKTSLAEALAAMEGNRLVRLQCYEGLAAHHALYEWDYARQLLTIRLAEARGEATDELQSRIFQPEFLLRRPLLEAIWPRDEQNVLLLIDEIDRADEEFEALLLEILSQFQITIPEIGTVKAESRPTVILTANRTRVLSDALRRRCLYHWIPFPSLDREIDIVRQRIPHASERLVRQGCMLVRRLRAGYYRKSPSIAETIDWVRALTLLGASEVEGPHIEETIGCLLKDSEDMRLFAEEDSKRVYREFGLPHDGGTR